MKQAGLGECVPIAPGDFGLQGQAQRMSVQLKAQQGLGVLRVLTVFWDGRWDKQFCD